MNNFINTLVEYIDQLEMDYPVKIGIFAEEPCLMVKPIEGSEVLHEYMNGMVDIRLPFEISIKSNDQEEAFNLLNDVMKHLKDMRNFLTDKSEDQNLLNLTMDQMPVFQARDGNYFYYSAKLTVDLTVDP